MPFVPLPSQKRWLLKETLPEGQDHLLFDTMCGYRVFFSLQCLVQSHSLDLLSRVLLTLC